MVLFSRSKTEELLAGSTVCICSSLSETRALDLSCLGLPKKCQNCRALPSSSRAANAHGGPPPTPRGLFFLFFVDAGVFHIAVYLRDANARQFPPARRGREVTPAAPCGLPVHHAKLRYNCDNRSLPSSVQRHPLIPRKCQRDPSSLAPSLPPSSAAHFDNEAPSAAEIGIAPWRPAKKRARQPLRQPRARGGISTSQRMQPAFL